jgi:ABC-type polysaccharide/polyol phosphate transport system ATPase subunit
MTSDVAIRFDDVSKRFRKGERFDSLRDLVPHALRRIAGRATPRAEAREFWALRHIDLEIRQGESVAVIGHNGAGKSTMLKHFAGIMHPTEGRIQVNGRLSALIEVGAGFHPDLTGRENVFLNGVILGMSRAEIARKFDEIVDFAGLADFIDTPIKRYSSGMFARLGFSVAAHLDPDILVIDEVLSVGDYVFQQKSMQKMRAIAGGGATVVFVSHNLKAVSELCARTLLMDGGKVVEDGPTSHVIQTYLERERAKLARPRDGEVVITSVTLRGVDGERTHFEAGETAWIDVEFKANRRCERVAVVLDVLDEGLDNIFNVSTERLGHRPVDLEPGEVSRVTFELTLHLVGGVFHAAVYLYRYDVSREYDRALPARTFFMNSSGSSRGTANLYPRVVDAGERGVVTPGERAA